MSTYLYFTVDHLLVLVLHVGHNVTQEHITHLPTQVVGVDYVGYDHEVLLTHSTRLLLTLPHLLLLLPHPIQ